MTFGPLLAVAAAIATEGRWSELNPTPSAATHVASVIRDYNKECWMNHCLEQLAACADFEESCERHFFCEQKPPVLAPNTCFASLRFADLSRRELGVFACAAENQCIREDHPALSFLQEALLQHGEKGLSVLALHSEEAAEKISSIMKLRAALQQAQTQYSRVVAQNTRTELSAVQKRLAKLLPIARPNTHDLLTFAVLDGRVKELIASLKEQLAAEQLRSKELPLDLVKIAKAPLPESQAPYLQKLLHVVDQTQRELRAPQAQAATVAKGRGTPRMKAATTKLRVAGAEQFVYDALQLAKNLQQQQEQQSKQRTQRDGMQVPKENLGLRGA